MHRPGAPCARQAQTVPQTVCVRALSPGPGGAGPSALTSLRPLPDVLVQRHWFSVAAVGRDHGFLARQRWFEITGAWRDRLWAVVAGRRPGPAVGRPAVRHRAGPADL